MSWEQCVFNECVFIHKILCKIVWIQKKRYRFASQSAFKKLSTFQTSVKYTRDRYTYRVQICLQDQQGKRIYASSDQVQSSLVFMTSIRQH